MPYAAFEVCTVPVGDDHQPHRGVRVKCGYCPTEEAIAINTVRSHGNDDETVEKMIVHKFEHKGWKIGKTASQHRCPKCFTAIKSAAKHKGEIMAANKVVPMNSTAVASQTVVPRGERAMTRDERRIIISKLQDIYLNESVGYQGDWTDEKVAEDMGVPRVWVAQIRDETFGPDVNENSVRIFHEARELLKDIQAAKMNLDPLVQQLQKLMLKADVIEQGLKQLERS